ncbi:MAG: hypothetical protein PHO07_04675 [Pirellulales bacterium]|nr:hypothetical protein [Pirellulales bacterium]
MDVRILRILAAAGPLAILLGGGWRLAEAAAPAEAPRQGVAVRILPAPFSGNPAPLGAPLERLPGALPRPLSGYPLLEAETACVALSPDRGNLTFWTRRAGRLTRRGEIALSRAAGPARFQLVADPRQGVAVEIGVPGGEQAHTIALSPDGILEIRQPPGATVTVRSPLRYALAPSLVGTDLLYDPSRGMGLQARPQVFVDGQAYVPSLGMVVGLGAGGDGMLVGVWPRGNQLVRLAVGEQGDRPTIESLAIDTDGKSFYVAFLDQPGIWHEEPLRDAYLETHTAIGWRRPFDARWIGRFFIDSDGYGFPFYFLSEKQKLWGRCIRGWFENPVWFDGDRTMVHFEKKFPPKGMLLVYFLDTYGQGGAPLSPVAVMQESLGEAEADQLLDFDGTQEQVLLEHRNAVCAMTAKIEAYFAKEASAPAREEIKQYADDVSTFIRLIRERVFEFERFAAAMEKWLKTETAGRPAVAADLEPCEEILAEIREVAAELPKTSLGEVRDWTEQLKTLSAGDREENLALAKKLTQKCRSVAGTQDDLARNLSVAAIRLMEEAAWMGARSPDHVRVAERMIDDCRGILRKPTWWEPCRKYLPKSNPGAP